MIKQLCVKLMVLIVSLMIGGCAVHKTYNQQNKDLVGEMKPDVLFIAYDYGESLAFKAVIPYLKARHLSIKVLAIGVAEKALSNLPEAITLQSLLTAKQQKDNQTLLKKWSTSREQELPSKLLASVVEKLRPSIVVTGMASSIQAQLTNQLVLKGAYTVAFYDNFDLPSTQSFIRPWLHTTVGVNELFLPGNYLIDSFVKLKPLSGSEITVVGQPALEDWVNTINNVNKTAVLNQLHLSSSKPVIVFASGYDDESIKWLNTFIDAMTDRPDFQVFIALHPKMQGYIPASIKSKIDRLDNVHVAPEGVSTQSLVKAASIVVTHKSTVGMKAAYSGVPVLYVASETYNNILIENKLAMRASSWSEIMNGLHRLVDRKAASLTPTAALGIPSQPIIRFDNRLLAILKGMTKTSKMPVLEKMQIEEKKTPRY